MARMAAGRDPGHGMCPSSSNGLPRAITSLHLLHHLYQTRRALVQRACNYRARRQDLQ